MQDCLLDLRISTAFSFGGNYVPRRSSGSRATACCAVCSREMLVSAAGQVPRPAESRAITQDRSFSSSTVNAVSMTAASSAAVGNWPGVVGRGAAMA
jgi:hypothetical protein